MSLVIVRPGPLASVQDLGRHGHRQLGICPGGALDTLGLSLANRLVGNADSAAGLELTMGNGEIRFEVDTRIALAGDAFGAALNTVPVQACWSIPVRAGQTLRLGGAPTGARPGLRTWLAVAGGIDVPEVLGSRSTDLKAGFGGMEGRALKKGDNLPLGPSPLSPEQMARKPFGIRAHYSGELPGEPTTLRVLPGPEAEQFLQAARKLLHAEPWRITPQSNRMGSRLSGPELNRRKGAGDMLSSGVVPGTVQVPPSGQPIILMGDAQTTGGYPRIAVVIRADLWKLAQAPLGGLLRLEEVDEQSAREAWNAQQRYLAQVAQGLALMNWPGGPSKAREAAQAPQDPGEPDDGN